MNGSVPLGVRQAPMVTWTAAGDDICAFCSGDVLWVVGFAEADETYFLDEEPLHWPRAMTDEELGRAATGTLDDRHWALEVLDRRYDRYMCGLYGNDHARLHDISDAHRRIRMQQQAVVRDAAQRLGLPLPALRGGWAPLVPSGRRRRAGRAPAELPRLPHLLRELRRFEAAPPPAALRDLDGHAARRAGHTPGATTGSPAA